MNITSAHLSAMAAFSMWGLLAIYWKLFPEVGAWDLFGHRLFWSFVTLVLIVSVRKKWDIFRNIFLSRKTVFMLTISALLISSNWLLYIYAVHVGRVLEASMGYFLNPLINIFMGWVILKKNIRPTQWPAIIMAMIAILLLALQTDLQHFPWLALILSITFALYGLVRKLAKVGSLEGLTFETSILVVPTILYWHYVQTSSPFTALEVMPHWKYGVLMLSGLATSLPLILFAYAAKRLPLQTLGFIQYLSPTLKFMCGLFLFHEALSWEKLQAFIIIWIALAYYTAESFYQGRKRIGRRIPPTE